MFGFFSNTYTNAWSFKAIETFPSTVDSSVFCPSTHVFISYTTTNKDIDYLFESSG
jgi:hypothetical protein